MPAEGGRHSFVKIITCCGGGGTALVVRLPERGCACSCGPNAAWSAPIKAPAGAYGMDASQPAAASYWRQQIENALLAPIRAMRLAYLPLLMVYFAYGAIGLTASPQSFWIKKSLTWTPAELAVPGRLVHAAVDHQDGVRRAGRHRAAARLAAPRLRVHRRRPDRRSASSCWRGPRAAGSRSCPPTSSTSSPR